MLLDIPKLGHKEPCSKPSVWTTEAILKQSILADKTLQHAPQQKQSESTLTKRFLNAFRAPVQGTMSSEAQHQRQAKRGILARVCTMKNASIIAINYIMKLKQY